MFRGKIRTVLLFAAVFSASFALFHALPLDWLEHATAQGSAAVLRAAGIDSSADGKTILLQGEPAAVIIPSCTGVDSLSILFALAAADPLMTRKRKAVMLCAGVPLLLSFNFVRIALTVISPEWFPMHFLTWMASAGLIFVLWTLFSKT